MAFDSVIIYISGVDVSINQKLCCTHILLYFICLLGTFSYESSIMGLIKIAGIPSSPSVTLFRSVADGIVTLGYFSFDYRGASCSLSSLSSEGIPGA